MTNALDPQGPAQPSLNNVYRVAGNKVDKEPTEQAASNAQSNSTSAPTDKRVPSTQADYDSATPSSLARGVHGVDHADYRTEATDGRSAEEHSQTDQTQMGAPGEGKVADAVESKPGASGAQPGLESGLDRKKNEQAAARASVDAEQATKQSVAGVSGHTGGPANPVGKNNYPNGPS